MYMCTYKHMYMARYGPYSDKRRSVYTYAHVEREGERERGREREREKERERERAQRKCKEMRGVTRMNAMRTCISACLSI